MITQEKLKELLHYNPETGLFTWLKPPSKGRGVVGDVVGTLCRGYLLFHFEGDNYKLHRLAVLYMSGEFPQGQVDHKNEIKSDNRWVNLRVCSNAENCRNRGRQTNNKFGIKGVDLLDGVGRKPRIRGSVSYSEFVNNPDGSRVWKKQNLSISRTFDKGDEGSKQKALAEVTEWLREVREKHHGEFANDN